MISLVPFVNGCVCILILIQCDLYGSLPIKDQGIGDVSLLYYSQRLMSPFAGRLGLLGARWCIAETDYQALLCVQESNERSDGAEPRDRDASPVELLVLHYQFTSFATPFPQEAADFCVKYFGGQLITDPSEYLTHRGVSKEAVVRGIRFPYQQGARHHDIYFIRDPTKPTGPGLDIDKFAANLHETHHFELQETWDWYQDWHYAFLVEESLDLVLYRLVQDGVPVVTRGNSFYVEIPGGMTFQFVGAALKMLWTENFSFCRYTDGNALYQPLKISDPPVSLPPIPELKPFHHSFASTNPTKASEFVRSFTSGTKFDMKQVWETTHRYSDGTCAYLEWVDFNKTPGKMMPEFQVHFVQQFRKYQGHNMTVAGVEEYLEELHGSMAHLDAFMDYRVGFWVDDLRPFEEALNAGEVPYLSMHGSEDGGPSSLLMQIPGGIIFELFTTTTTTGDDLAVV